MITFKTYVLKILAKYKGRKLRFRKIQILILGFYMIAIILSKLGLFVGSAFKAWTNKTGRCPSSAFLKIVSAIFVRLKMSLATLWPLNPPTISGAICGNSLGRSGLWLVPENLCFSSTNQKPERWRPFGTGVVRHCPQGLFSPFFTFLRATFFRLR